MQHVSNLSHIALIVKDIEHMVEFYQYFAEMELIHKRIDEGVKVAWLRLSKKDSLIIVMIEDSKLITKTYQRMNHFGFDAPSREAVDAIAQKGQKYGCLKYAPFYGGEILGYLCLLEDPDGNQLEFAYGQMRTE